MSRPCKSIELANKRAESRIKLAEVAIKLTESLIRLADTLAERVENIDVLAPPDISRVAIEEAMLMVSQSMKLMALFKRVI